ncbi:MAG: TIGR03032 family protein [Desmonostoc vinosum HA7617-LM4]|jgi:hypothetical protein|nr:TIGR03032 family protein [Desmonostoc vinosum HA7617-LM4]
MQLISGVVVVDCRSGQQIGLFEFTSGVQELCEVQFLPGKMRPTILNTEMEAVRDAFTAPDAYWLHPESLMDEFQPQNSLWRNKQCQ